MFTIERRQYSDCEQLSEAIKGGFFENVPSSKGSFRGALLRAELADGVLDSGFYVNSVHARGHFPKNSVTVTTLLCANDESLVNGVGLVPGDLMFMKEGAEVVYASAPETVWVSFQMKREDLRSLGVDFGKDENKIYKRCSSSHHPFMAALSSLAYQLQKAEAKEVAFLDPKQIYNHLVEKLAYLLTSEQEQVILEPGAYLQSASMVKHLLNDSIGEIIQVSDLCRFTGKSERTLERICTKAFGMSPRVLLKSHRLNSVRKALLGASRKNVNVTHLALEHGFTHPGRFSGEYKKFFGELPSQTLFRNSI